MLKNTPTRYGSLTKLFHWAIFGLFCYQYYLIWKRSLLIEHAPERMPLIVTHRSVGMTLLGLSLLFFIWRAINPKPRGPHRRAYADAFTLFIKYALLACMVLMPISGYLLACAGGKITRFWGWFDFPQIISENKVVLSFFISMHEILAILIVVFVSLHVLDGLFHQFYWKEKLLQQMLPRKHKKRVPVLIKESTDDSTQNHN